MSRNTKVFSLKKFWEKKLKIKYDIELEHYKKLCGHPYKYKMLINNPDLCSNSGYITYGNWKKHILIKIENLTVNQLKEYSRFLNQQYRNRESKLISFRTLLIPYVICVISAGILTPVFNILMDVSLEISAVSINIGHIIVTIIILLICIVPIFISIYIFCQLNKRNDNESICQYFYQDMKEIVDERIKQLEDKKRAGD